MNKRFIFLLVVLFAFLWILPFNAKAAKFTNIYVRLNNQNANQSINATICANPSSIGAGVENKVVITFPNQFSISSTTSNWTIDTSNLPSGAIAWPGVGATATSVSGKSVTFASSDLISNSLFCFNVLSSASNNGSSGTDEYGVVTTKDGSDTIIDSTTYGVSVINNNQVSISANVDPQISDLPISIASTTSGSTIPQDTIVNYQITYGTNTAGSIPLTIQAEWSEGTIQGDPSPTVDILNYYFGSATNAYGGTTPVIDTINRKITWTISSIPGGTIGQTLTFKLKTTSNYTGTLPVDFTASARATSGTTVTPDQSVNQQYLFVPPPVIVKLPGDGRSDGKSDGLSDNKQSTNESSSELYFNNIYIYSISQSEAKIAVITSKNSKLTFKYGITPKNLNTTIKTLVSEKQTLIDIPGLNPSTDYFFTITATDENGKTITSDIFTFRTAIVSPIPSINLNTLLVTSSDNVLLNPSSSTNSLDKNIIIIPRNSLFSIQFALEKAVDLKRIQAIVRNSNVLGFNTGEAATAGTNFIDLVEVRQGIYTGRIASAEPGAYELYVRLVDFNGNILEEKVADLSVTYKLRVYKGGTKNQPVENARLLLYLYNPTTKIYEVISSNILPLQNPSYSNPDGTFDIVLPYGQYKADISALGFSAQNIFFQILPYKGGYPTIFLEPEAFNPLNTINYYWDTFKDFLLASQNYVRQHADSNRLFDLSAMAAVFLFIVLTILSISARTHVHVLYLPFFMVFKLGLLFRKNNPRMLFGKVLEKGTNLPVSKAFVYLKTPDGKENISTLKTNKLGEFYYRNLKGMDYQITIEKKGYILEKEHNFKNSNITQIPAILTLKKSGEIGHSFAEILFVYTEDLLGLFMETLIILGLILQIYFIFTFGLLRIAPFLVLTIFNLILMFTYLYKPKGLEE